MKRKATLGGLDHLWATPLSPAASSAVGPGAQEDVFGTIACAENLRFMRSLPDACCDLIYLDPPFGTNRRRRTSSHGVGFEDPGLLAKRFVRVLRPRLLEMRRLLTGNGSVFVHVDWRTSHYVRLLLDRTFGPANFLNEIIWSYRSGSRPGRWFARKHDVIFSYAKRLGDHIWNEQRGGEYRTRDLQFDDDGHPYKTTRKGRIAFDPRGPATTDVWEIPILSTVSLERTGYPTQKPEALLTRIIEAGSRKGSCVGDFYCGSGTTLFTAATLERRWIGCDENPSAVAIARRRLSVG